MKLKENVGGRIGVFSSFSILGASNIPDCCVCFAGRFGYPLIMWNLADEL